MATKGRYANPPVVEALCELHFAGGSWDETVPGRLYDRLVPLGFERKEPVELHEANLSIDGHHGPSALLSKRDRMRFATRDRSRLVQVEPSLVVVNQLRPYPDFESWCPLVIEVGKQFAALTGSRSVDRVGMRYINQVDLSGNRIDLDLWFRVAPKLPASWHNEAGSFLVRAERTIRDQHGMILTLASAASTGEMSSFVLDLYSVTKLSPAVAIESVQPVLDEAHASIEDAFEGSITQALRDRFGAVTKE